MVSYHIFQKHISTMVLYFALVVILYRLPVNFASYSDYGTPDDTDCSYYMCDYQSEENIGEC